MYASSYYKLFQWKFFALQFLVSQLLFKSPHPRKVVERPATLQVRNGNYKLFSLYMKKNLNCSQLPVGNVERVPPPENAATPDNKKPGISSSMHASYLHVCFFPSILLQVSFTMKSTFIKNCNVVVKIK